MVTDRERIDGLLKIAGFFEARADMAVGDAKMLLLNWMKCAQEAAEVLEKQTPRVMTLEEALGGEECWVEYPNGGCGYADCYLSYTSKGADIYRTMQHDFNVPLDNYGKTWRCWTSRPTDEQRKKVKWG